jgi:hypothetical protein
MKIEDTMRYPHPVLSELTKDYTTGEFTCELTQQMTPSGELKLTSTFKLTSNELKSLIDNQQASAGYFLVCRRTFYNKLEAVPVGTTDRHFPAADLFGTVTVRPIVWTLKEVQNYSSKSMHQEFGQSIRIRKGAIIAIGPEFRFSMDKRKFKPFESIFELAEDPTVEPGTFVVDPLRDKITIYAEKKTYTDLSNLRGLPRGRDILLNAVYMPAVMEVFSTIQAGESSIVNQAWYRIFKAKCDDIGMNPLDATLTPARAAQKLLRAPLKKTISVMGTL